MKSSPVIWCYVASVKSSVKILSIFVAFLENMNKGPKNSRPLILFGTEGQTFGCYPTTMDLLSYSFLVDDDFLLLL